MRSIERNCNSIAFPVAPITRATIARRYHLNSPSVRLVTSNDFQCTHGHCLAGKPWSARNFIPTLMSLLCLTANVRPSVYRFRSNVLFIDFDIVQCIANVQSTLLNGVFFFVFFVFFSFIRQPCPSVD